MAKKPYDKIRIKEIVDGCGIGWRHTLRTLLSENGDPYFLKRLQNQIRANLNDMMDYDGAPNDERRLYYVELLTASYVGMLTYVVFEENEKSLISVHEMAEIANSTRTAFFRTDDEAPHISDEQLFGRSDDLEH